MSEKTTLLWENASPTSSFEEQDLYFDLSDYQLILIMSFSKNQYVSSVVSPVGYKFIISTAFADGGQSTNYYRYGESTKTSIHFASGWVAKYNSDIKDDLQAVPIRIYGIRGIT